MLAVVKKPHIELSINGDNIKELVKYIRARSKEEAKRMLKGVKSPYKCIFNFVAECCSVIYSNIPIPTTFVPVLQGPTLNAKKA